MAVDTTYLKGEGNSLNNVCLGNAFTKSFVIDAAVNAITNADVLKLMTIPADTVIEGAVCNVITAEGSALTVNVGDYTIATDIAIDADNFLGAIDCNAVAKTLDAAPVTAAYYGAKTAYVGALFSAAVAAAKVEIIIYGRKLTV